MNDSIVIFINVFISEAFLCEKLKISVTCKYPLSRAIYKSHANTFMSAICINETMKRQMSVLINDIIGQAINHRDSLTISGKMHL